MFYYVTLYAHDVFCTVLFIRGHFKLNPATGGTEIRTHFEDSTPALAASWDRGKMPGSN